MSDPPLTGRETLQIRSFRVVFALERRLFKVDRFRLPFAYGVPLRAIGYAAVALGAVVLVGRLPLLGTLVGMVPPPLRLVGFPVAVAAVLTRLRVDGLPAHRAAGLWLAHRLTPRQIVAFRLDPAPRTARVTEPLVFVPDAAGPRLRPAVVAGAATVTLGVPARAAVAPGMLVLEQAGDRALRTRRRLRIPAGGRVVIR